MHVLKLTSIICEQRNNWSQQFKYKAEDTLEQLRVTSIMPVQMSITVILNLIERKNYKAITEHLPLTRMYMNHGWINNNKQPGLRYSDFYSLS